MKPESKTVVRTSKSRLSSDGFRSKFLLAVLCLLTAANSLWADDVVIRKTSASITFEVDGLLPAPKYKLRYLPDSTVAQCIVDNEQLPHDDGTQVVDYSFRHDSLVYRSGDVMFDLLRTAYADHRPVTLSPDAVWLIVSQGFSRYVNAHAEEMRPLLVAHEGKQTLSVVSQDDLLSPKVDWSRLMQDFTRKLRQQTKGDLVQTVTADFSTTTATERIASQVVLMDVFKQYFNYEVITVVCGIPHITLTGTPQDWHRVLSKAQQLKVYPSVAPWIAQLEPVLQEFIQAAEGRPRQAFWQSIVRQQRVGELRGGGCSADKATPLDGWFLKFFPDENGEVRQQVGWDYRHMPSEMVRVGFKYKKVAPGGDVLSETPMELWAGFVGMKANATDGALAPRIGWLVRTANEAEELVHKFYEADQYGSGIHLRDITEVPLALSQLERIHSLTIEFTKGPVTLPDWFYRLQIDSLTLKGQFSAEQEERLRKAMPRTEISINP